jgi:hypothetical protein
MQNEKAESILIEGSPRGISVVTVRASRERRDRGLALLQSAMHSIVELDRALRADSTNKAIKPQGPAR